MPQIFQVLCCYSCEMFQVHQVKKSNKWQCRGCNEKQSLKKAFKIGSARECRYLVQELNMRKADLIQEDLESSVNEEFSDSEFKEECHSSDMFERNEESYSNQSAKQWEFSNETVPSDDDDDNRWLSDFNFEPCEEKSSANRSNFLTENSHGSTDNIAVSKTCDSVNHCDPIIDRSMNFKNTHKRPFETKTVESVEKDVSPPFKKHRGFQLILKAASKLS